MSWHAAYALLRRELRSLARERTVLIAFFIQLFIASFSSALLMGLLSVYDPDAQRLSEQLRPRVAVVSPTAAAPGAAPEALVAALRAHHARVQIVAEPEMAQHAFEEGNLDAAILLPEPSAARASGSGQEIELVLPESETQATLMRLVLRKPLAAYENELRRQNGIELRYQELGDDASTGYAPSTGYEFRYGALVPLLMFFPAFVTGGIVVDTIAEELANRTLETLWSAPLSLNAIVGTKVVAGLVISFVQSVAWAALLRLNGIEIQQLGAVLLLAALGAALVALVSAAIALAFGDRERSQFAYALFILLATGISYLSDLSPIVLVSRFATGDPAAGMVHLLGYVVVVGAAAAVVGRLSRRLLMGRA
jgi:ABC-type Na+ efflux pump permease subunit